jgi:hypothetical protein
VDFLGIKIHRILCRIKKYKLSIVKIAPTKVISKKTCEKMTFRFVSDENTFKKSKNLTFSP